MLRNIAGALTVALLSFAPLGAAPALAEAFNITEADPVAVITVPDDWEGKKVGRGVQIKTPDDEIYMWVELIPPSEIDAVQKEHNSYFDNQGVTVEGTPETVQIEVNGRPWVISELKAKAKGEPSVIRYVAINPKVASGKLILLTYWASLEGDKKYNDATTKMLENLGFK